MWTVPHEPGRRPSTGQPRERITVDIDRDCILRGAAAVAYGVVDHVVEAAGRRVALPEPAAVLNGAASG